MAPTPADVPTADGVPMLGLGTWENDDYDDCVQSVKTALEMGYRHIDTAQIYGNEAAVGEGIEQADVPREDIFLATKVWIDQLSYDDVLASTEESLEKLGTEYVDLLYVHWPAREYEPAETLRAFDELYDDDVIHRVGVSNFEPHHVDEAREHLDAPVFADQVECHPFLQQEELREYADSESLELVAYSPLARSDVIGAEPLTEIAAEHDASEPQVALAWLREKGVTAIPKATSEEHIRDNWESLTLELSDDEIETIDAITRKDRKVNPGFGPDAWE
ncbi:aldo/keto reductase [Halovenus salina]|uniref:Aldo/keto reductase n=1 Tax=Halovenus salina TaxID=1510225 RepID=A0ABD5W142_9EURY|nr:aldo/keto reductase [Halovenus salina]